MPELLNLIGHTPLLPLHHALDLPDGVELYGKAEWYNLGGSVKDRPALWMIRDGEQ
ncbi:MAG: cysteine synthase, partial [Chloroflexi bacterium]